MRPPVTRTRRSHTLLAGHLVGALAVAAGLSGCAAFSESSASDGTPGSSGSSELRIATAFYPLEYVSSRVAGDLATVENLTTPGQEPHDLELSVRESAELAQADLVVFETGFQPAVDDAVEQNATGTALDAAEVVDLLPASGSEEHAGEDGEHEGEEHAGEEGGHEGDEHGDEHGDEDPHFWQDPVRLAELGDAVAEELAGIDPDHAEDYRTNAASLRSDLEALDQEFTTGLARCERSTVVVSHDAFAYLGKYGVTFESIAGLSPDAEPTPADLGRLQDLIRAEGITTVFGERLVSPRLTETLASDLGIGTAVLDPLEGLSDDTAGQDYLSLMQENLAALKEANGCQ